MLWSTTRARRMETCMRQPAVASITRPHVHMLQDPGMHETRREEASTAAHQHARRAAVCTAAGRATLKSPAQHAPERWQPPQILHTLETCCHHERLSTGPGHQLQLRQGWHCTGMTATGKARRGEIAARAARTAANAVPKHQRAHSLQLIRSDSLSCRRASK